MAQSLFISLKAQDEDCEITVLAPEWTRPLLDRMPQVDHSIGLPVAHGELKLGARRALGKSLRSKKFSSAIILPNSFKSALIPFHAKIPRRIGWRGEWRNPILTDCRKLTPANLPLMAQRFVALAYPARNEPPTDIPRPGLTTDPDSVDAALQTFELQTNQAVLAICPGAEYGASKQWPAAHYAKLANAMMARGWQVWIFGSANDVAIAGEIARGLDVRSWSNLAGNTSLAQAIDLMSVAAVVVSNDSGLMHIAAAAGTPGAKGLCSVMEDIAISIEDGCLGSVVFAGRVSAVGAFKLRRAFQRSLNGAGRYSQRARNLPDRHSRIPQRCDLGLMLHLGFGGSPGPS